MSGPTGDRMIRVDMTNQTAKIEPYPEEWALLGGRALSARILLAECDPTCDPLGPDNVLVMAPGVLRSTSKRLRRRSPSRTKATATEVGVTGVRRQPWANAPFIPGALADYMNVQFKFFNSKDLKDSERPILAGLNYFLTHEARGGTEGKKLLGEKRDVKVWLSWLERRSHADVEAMETPIGFLPLYGDLEKLFRELIDKDYPRSLYDMQFSLYVDKIVARIDLQHEAYGKEENLPATLFEVYEEQKKGLEALKAKFGPVVTPEQLGG